MFLNLLGLDFWSEKVSRQVLSLRQLRGISRGYPAFRFHSLDHPRSGTPEPEDKTSFALKDVCRLAATPRTIGPCPSAA